MYGGTALIPTERKTIDCLRKRTETEKTVVRLRVSADDRLLKKARVLGAELFNIMDLKAMRKISVGSLLPLLSNARKSKKRFYSITAAPSPIPGNALWILERLCLTMCCPSKATM